MKYVAAGILVLSLMFSVSAENNVSTELSLLNLVIFDEGNTPDYVMMGGVDLNFSSSGFKNMKGTLSLGFSDSSYPDVNGITITNSVDPFRDISIKQLEIKARFPEFRLTTGLTRLDWGEGTLLNSANVLFSDDTEAGNVSFDQNSVELQKKWLLSIQKPLSSFSFLEAVGVAPEDGNLKHSSGGIRYYNGENPVAWETGIALTRGDSQSFITPHLAVSGGSLVEWYTSFSTSFSLDENAGETAKDKLNGSAGIFQIFSFDNGNSMTAQLEGRFIPFSEADDRVLLYPSVIYSLAGGAKLSLQSIYAPVDGSATITAGGSWNILDGFTASAYCAADTGESDDTYPYEGVTAIIGFTALF